jgi:SAM-dependent methyltransferase
MPDADALAKMYGPAYASAGGTDATIEDPREPGRVLARLRERPPGKFIDFGCGSGSLLVAARALGWTAVGVEFHADVARATATATGCDVFNGLVELRRSTAVPADAVHLGDVVEHLTSPAEVLQELVGLLRPRGWLLAQGPLEAGPCLFSIIVRARHSFRPAHPTEMAPYHVLQATVRGQRLLFERVGLEPLEYRISEVAWPARRHLSACLLAQPRSLALFTLRKVSQAISKLNPGRWGNRYFYVGVAGGVGDEEGATEPLGVKTQGKTPG